LSKYGLEQGALKIVVGIPSYNVERTIAKVVIRAREHADSVLVVDDGSKDDTGLIAKSLGAVVITHEKNLGKGAGLRDCFEWAKQNGADILVTLDADGQHDPSKIPSLTDALTDSQADVVVGSRTARPADMPRYRWIGERALDSVTRVKVGGKVVDAQSGFRAYSRRAIENLAVAEFGMGADSEIIMKADSSGMRIIEVPVASMYAGLDSSTHNPVMHALDVFFSVLKFISIRHPLLFYGGFSIISLTISLIYGLMTLDYYQRWGRVVTNIALVSVASGILGFLALFTGIILFTLITVVRESSSR
jgi:glycosyltransferase involved in cell wall biosynthesis